MVLTLGSNLVALLRSSKLPEEEFIPLSHPLYYSVAYWLHHSAAASGAAGTSLSSTSKLSDMVFQFFQDNAFRDWAKVFPSDPTEYAEHYTWLSPADAQPLHIASSYGLTRVVERLIGGGAHSVMPKKEHAIHLDALDNTPLFWALLNRHDTISRLLSDKGAGVSVVDKRRFTPLHIAVERGDKFMFQRLIDIGTKVSAADQNGVTPLHTAALHGRVEVARLLIDKGAHISATDRDEAVEPTLGEAIDCLSLR
ncbi:ankyrin repeat-containing domain protein [Trichophaea hybrida]|nr:ankyrin repeat-containing domain protein [Trichophaea hybrida]